MEGAGVVEENEVCGNQDYKKREFNHGAKQKNQTPIMYPSDRVECPTSSAIVYGDRLESTSLSTPMSLVASGPPNFNPFSMKNTGVPVEELTVRNCGIQMNEGMHSELGYFPPHIYKMESMARSKSAHEDNMSRDKGQIVLHAREDLRRMSSDSRDQNILSRTRFNRDPEEVSAQLTNGYNKIMSNSSLQFGNSQPKILSAPNFSQLFLKKALKDKVIAGRALQSHSIIAVADTVRNDNHQDSSHVLDSLGTRSSDEGISLREWLSIHSRYHKVECLNLFKKIVEIVDCAHSQGMVLQKLRPSHFMLSSPDVVKYSGPLTMADVEITRSYSTAKKRSLEHGTLGCQCFVSKQQKYSDVAVSVKHQAQCRYNCGSESVNEALVDSPSLLSFRHNACSSTSNSSRQSSLPVNSQLEENWYISPEELSGSGCSLPSNIYALGVLLFELLNFTESSHVRSTTLSNFRDRVLPPKMLSQHPIEMVFCLRMCHPEALSRPSIRQVLQSELLHPSEPSANESLPSIHKDVSESELLIDFLTALDEQKQKQASKLVDEIWFLEEDMKEVKRRNMKMFSGPSCTNRESSVVLSHKMLGKDPLGSDPPHGSLSEPNMNNPKLLRDIKRLEKTYFCLRSKIERIETQPELRTDKHLLKSCVSEGLHQEHADVLGDFFEGLCKYSCYSKLEVCGTLKTGDVFSSANVICSLGFDRDEDFIATAGVSKKIKIFEFDALLNDSVDIHYPVIEMTNKSRLSCLCWNNYIKNYLASTDYEGIVQIWDGSTGQGLSRYSEHQKGSWSVDFSQVDPKRFASGSDDCSVKLWSINQKSSAITIPSPANVCCAQFSPTTANLLAFGSADYKLYCYDLRHTRLPWCTLAGHGKTVSNVRFLNSDTLVSSSTDGTLKLWDLKKTKPSGLSLGACTLTFNGHTNVKNFVGLSVLDGYIACGSETNEVYTYYKSLPVPVTSYKFGSTDSLSGHPIVEDGAHVSSVCWRRKSNMVVAANSTGSVKLLRLV